MSIVVKELTKIYGSGEAEVRALSGVSTSFDKDEFCAIVGTSGSGKTTLLHMLGGLDTPTSGSVFYGETDIYTLGDRKLSEIRRKKCGFVFQFFNLIPELTAEENIVLPVLLDNGKIDTAYINELAELLGISDRLSHYPSQMSGGQQQRVAIARALANNPEILFCDEPTGNLDKESGNHVIEMLCKAQRKLGKTVIVVTHDNDIANRADRIIRIADGAIIEDMDNKH
ncbi:MAG: ABC transporter ATP-binding protein [Lachnospiraceae bacterium]|nr:ABC transporter ATP-binding protein [Lachnospiraceae bacterium]